jgi:hypothetical protein
MGYRPRVILAGGAALPAGAVLGRGAPFVSFSGEPMSRLCLASMLAAAFTVMMPFAAATQTQWLIVEAEGGPVWQSYNDAEIPNDADALAAGPGRAVDAAVKLGSDFGERWSVLAGHRTVEDGADVEEVYSFAWLHYAALSVIGRR